MIAWTKWRKRRERQRMMAVVGVFLANPSRKFYALDLIRLAGVPASSIYGVLGALERLEIVRSHWEPRRVGTPKGHRPRRVYTLARDVRERVWGWLMEGV